MAKDFITEEELERHLKEYEAMKHEETRIFSATKQEREMDYLEGDGPEDAIIEIPKNMISKEFQDKPFMFYMRVIENPNEERQEWKMSTYYLEEM